MYNGWGLGVAMFLPGVSCGRHESNKQCHVGHRALLPRCESHVRDFARGGCILKMQLKFQMIYFAKMNIILYYNLYVNITRADWLNGMFTLNLKKMRRYIVYYEWMAKGFW